MAGDGPARAEVGRALEPLGDGGVLAGWREDAAEVLDAVDVLLHPSRVDAFPTALIEALAAGVPIVATAVGGIPEIVDDRTTGVLVPAPPAPEALVGALEPLLSDGERRARMGGSAREAYVERFTAERWAARTRDVYERVIAARTAA